MRTASDFHSKLLYRPRQRGGQREGRPGANKAALSHGSFAEKGEIAFPPPPPFPFRVEVVKKQMIHSYCNGK